MTTAYKQNQSPRLPENHPAHIERILAKSHAQKYWSTQFVIAVSLLGFTVLWVAAFFASYFL